MGKEAMPLHHYTLPLLTCLYSHTLSLSLAVRSLLSSPFVNYALRCQTCSCCAQIHLQGCIIRTLATWAIFHPREADWRRPTAGCGRPFCAALKPHCWTGQTSRVWHGYTGQGVWSMAIGPVWDALIHATSCHLPPLPACSLSAAARLLSLIMSIFRAGRFLPSKMGKCVLKQEGVCVHFFLSFLDILLCTGGQLVHVSRSPAGSC